MADIADIRIRLLTATQPEELLTAALEAFTLALAVRHARQFPICWPGRQFRVSAPQRPVSPP